MRSWPWEASTPKVAVQGQLQTRLEQGLGRTQHHRHTGLVVQILPELVPSR